MDTIEILQGAKGNEVLQSLYVETVTDAHQLESIKEEWDNIEQCFGSPLLASDWFITSSEAFYPSNQLKAITTKFLNSTTGIAPFCTTGNFLPFMEFAGSSILQEPGGFIYQDRKSLEKLIHSSLEADLPLNLNKLYADSEEVEVLEKKLANGRFISRTQEYKIPFVKMDQTWEEFEKTQISSSRRSSFRRLQRKAEKKGKLRFQVIIPTTENLNEHLEEVFRIEASGWKARNGTALDTHPLLGKFFCSYALRMAKQRKLHLFFLKVDDNAIAVQFTVLHANKLWILKIGFDEEWSWCSPGFLLMNEVVRFCFEEELTSCEFLGSNEKWLHIWANGHHDLISYRIFPKSIKGKWYELLFCIQTCSRTVINKIRRRITHYISTK